MKKRIALLVAILMLLFVIAGCGGGTTTESSDPGTSASVESSDSSGTTSNSDIVIGMSMSEDTQFLTNVRKAAEKQAKELGITLEVTSGQSKIEKQINDMESFITKKVDAIIFNPLDRDAMDEVVDKVADAGIPLVEVNTFTTNDRYDVYVGSPEEDAGRIQGNWIAENLGEEGGIAIMYGVMGHSGQIGRYNGLKEALLDKYSGWKVIVDKTGEWKREEGQTMMEDWLLTYADQIDVVASQNDEMAMGAVAALEEAGKQDQIKVLGIDASPDAIQMVMDGDMAITVFQDCFTQGAESVNVALGLINGETYDKTFNVPYREVNKDNAQEFMDLMAEWE